MLEAIILGLIQGLTEFLPVSSSGHLVIVPYLVGWESPPLAFDVAVHAATLIAVLIYFCGDLWYLATRTFGIGSTGPQDTHRARKTLLLLAVSSVPAAIAGFLLEPVFEETFDDPRIVATMLFVTGGLLWFAEWTRRRRVSAELRVPPRQLTPQQARRDPGRHEGTTTIVDAVTIGCAQALAIVPGISRSGATIAAGMVRGLSREGAARFSFLMVIPVIAGAFVFQLGDLTGEGMDNSTYGGEALIAGMLAAGLSGYWAIRYLLRLVTTDDLVGFARYVVFFGALTLFGTLWLGPAGQL